MHAMFAARTLPRTQRRAIAHAARLAVLAWLPVAGLAQTPDAGASQVLVTGNPFGAPQFARPASVLSGDALTLRREGTLGETLNGLPGVAATGFGPQSSRPVIRGLDGDRIRLLDNGDASIDASSLSYDHAVALEPLLVERIEVLRGPAAMLYGGSAIGGVVNSIDNRMPRAPSEGLGGRAEVRFGGAASERAGAAMVEGGAGGVSWHVDAAVRRTDDLKVPMFTPIVDGEPQAPRERVVNSAGDTEAGALGASWSDARGFVGVAVDTYRNDYGIVVEPDVTIAMKRDRVQLAGERRELEGWFERVEFVASATRYRHREIEGDGEVGTTFDSEGRTVRLLGTHRTFDTARWPGSLRGVIGVQAERVDFSALGEEAFVPSTRTDQGALFALEKWSSGGTTWGLGARVERVRVESQGDEHEPREAVFGPAQSRSFTPGSVSLSWARSFGAGWAANVALSRTQRAPTYYELYANGKHVATGLYEVGDPDQALEDGRQVDVGARWRHESTEVAVNAFGSRFANYIALQATGEVVDGAGEDGEAGSLPVYAYVGVPARLYGAEVEARTQWRAAGWLWTALGGFDVVRGTNRDTSQPLPRLPPWRLRVTLDAANGPWSVGGRVSHAARQDRVPDGDEPTPSSTIVDVWAAWRSTVAGVPALWYLRLANLTDELTYNAVAIPTVRALSPAGARAVSAGVRIDF